MTAPGAGDLWFIGPIGGTVVSVAQLDLRPVTVRTQPARRLPQLLAGLVLYGTSIALMTRANLGLSPWDVLHQGIVLHTGLTFGTATFVVSAFVLLMWVPLKQRPGVGTVANVIVIAITVDLARAVIPEQHAIGAQLAMLVGGVLLNGFATATYVGTRLGPGPRDGLMTGLSARTGRSVRLVRTCIELTVLATGWLLGGSVGLGTVLYAFGIGPLTQAFLRFVAWRPGKPAG